MLKNASKNLPKKTKVKQEIFTPSIISFIATIFIMIGVFLLTYNYIKEKKELAYQNMYVIDVNETTETTTDIPKEETTTSVISNNYNKDYIGYLEIPKIKLKKGFFSKDSKYNNVDKNILVLKDSDYPDKDKSNLIIVGHSGDNYNSYFRYLYKLNVDDIAYVIYKNKMYTYKIVSIENQPKTGQITINRNYDYKVLTLITCTYNNESYQTVYNFELTLERDE